MPHEDTWSLAEQVVFGVAAVSRGSAYVLFDEMSPKELTTPDNTTRAGCLHVPDDV